MSGSDMPVEQTVYETLEEVRLRLRLPSSAVEVYVQDGVVIEHHERPHLLHLYKGRTDGSWGNPYRVPGKSGQFRRLEGATYAVRVIKGKVDTVERVLRITVWLVRMCDRIRIASALNSIT